MEDFSGLINNSFKEPVIPAKAGIQLIYQSPRKRDNTFGFVCFAGWFLTGFRPTPE
jgi:hypothetical protein